MGQILKTSTPTPSSCHNTASLNYENLYSPLSAKYSNLLKVEEQLMEQILQ